MVYKPQKKKVNASVMAEHFILRKVQALKLPQLFFNPSLINPFKLTLDRH
jgi:hypothetical protein